MYFSGFPLKHWQRAKNTSFIVETRFIHKRCSSTFSDVYRIAYHVDMNTTLARHEHLSSLSPTISNDRSAWSSYAPLQKPLRKHRWYTCAKRPHPIWFSSQSKSYLISNTAWLPMVRKLYEFVRLFVCLALDDCSKQVRYRGTPLTFRSITRES